jgi:hypothetical protein
MGQSDDQTIDFRLAAAGRFRGFLVESPVGRLGVVKAVQPDPCKRDVEFVVVPGADTCLFVPLVGVTEIDARRGFLSVGGDVAVTVTEPLRSQIAADRVSRERVSAVDRSR